MMDAGKEIIIYNSRKKILIQIRRGILFIALFAFGFYISSVKPTENAALMRVMAPPMIILFTITLGLEFRKLKDKAPGLILNSNGILDNNTNKSVGLISWNEISNIAVTKIRSTRILTIDVYNHDQFLSRGKVLTRLRNWSNNIYFGSPIILLSTTLDLEFDELVILIDKYHLINRGV